MSEDSGSQGLRRASDRLATKRAHGKEVSFSKDAFESEEEDEDDDDFFNQVSRKSSPWDDEVSSPQNSKAVHSQHSGTSQHDSFDDPVVFGAGSNCSDEGTSSSRRESSYAPDPFKIISSVFSNVFDNGSFNKGDVAKIATMCNRAVQAGDEHEKKIVTLLTKTLERAVTSEVMREESIVAICVIIAKVAVRSHLEMCDLPFRVIRSEILGYNTCKLSHARQRICELIGCLLSIDENDSCIADLMEESEDEMDEETASEVGYTLKAKVRIPKLLITEWSYLLCDRRLDKESSVRCSAVKALAMIPTTTVTNRDGKKMKINKCVLQSLTDVSADVRRSAVAAVSFSIRGNVNKCIDFVGCETNSNVRIAMLGRLIKDVHLSSYTSQQRTQLIRMIHQDSEASIRSMISSHLVPKWMSCSFELPLPSQELSSTLKFPSDFVSFIDYQSDFDMAENLMKCAILHFIEKLPVRRNGTEIVTYLRENDVATSVPLLLNPVDVKTMLKTRPSNIQDACFVHYCLIEALMQIHSDRSQSAIRDDCLVRLLPNLTELARQLKSFCYEVFLTSEASLDDVLVVKLMCRLLRRLDVCEVGLKAWSDCISFIAANIRIFPPLSLVEFAMTELLDEVRNRSTDIQQQLIAIGEWACYSIGEIYSHTFGEETQPIPGSVTANLQYPLHRSAIILHSILSYPGFTELTALMLSAFERLVPLLHSINEVNMRKLAARLIGLACTMNLNVFYEFVNMLRHSLQLDFDEVKSVALLSTVEVVIVRGFKETAKFCFPEIDESERNSYLVKLFEKVAGNIDEIYLPDISLNCLRLIYIGQINWPILIGSILLRSFPKTVSTKIEESQSIIASFFGHLVQLGPTGRMQLLSIFLNALNQLEELDVSSIKLGQMSSFFLSFFLDVKTNDTDSPGEGKKNATNIVVTYCYIREVLHHILKCPDGVCVGPLITYTLAGFDFGKITDGQLRNLVTLIDCTSQKLEVVESIYTRSMKKFITTFNNAAKERGIETISNSTKRILKDVEKEESVNGNVKKHVKEEPSSPAAKKRRATISNPTYDFDSFSDDSVIFMEQDDFPSSSRRRRAKPQKRNRLTPTMDHVVIELSSGSSQEVITIDIDSKSDDPASDDLFSGN